ncbi:cyanophycinase [Pseudoalteromonas sp. Isolate6]|uniref:cyanophycinase n=1 Tax=Pseudoalteromonas sp. Isolate6 TaxID=2908527 RepID=UPI001EFC4AA2|nr:cyanophycinase [Pseudoalteromonas sp. Isolate6]MCG9761497.1 cyanophycinase [Pseudoalteromonas sp. Isolate6]
MNVAFFTRSVITVCTLFFSLTSSAQTLYLIGGALKTCSSMATKNCEENVEFSAAAKTHLLFSVDEMATKRFAGSWPTANKKHLKRTLKLLENLPLNKALSKTDLTQWVKQLDDELYREWSNKEFYFFFDMLELPLLYQHKRIPELVNTEGNSEVASTEILEDIVASITKTKDKKLLLVTASSRDPYESADFYQGLFQDYDIDAQWLPLTPALAAAINNNACKNLDFYRNTLNGIYNREAVYPDRTLSEYKLCQRGVEQLTRQIKSADAIMFNGGDQSLTKQVMYSSDTQTPYPWTVALKQVPIVIGTSAGTAVQSGGKNNFGNVPMITNGSSIEALQNGALNAAAPAQNCDMHGGCGKLISDSLTYDPAGGLGTFSYGILDTHFSERGRSFRLAVLAQQSGQKFGFGVDETTALKLEKTTGRFSVIGKKGVVVVEALTPQRFYYSFHPASSKHLMSALYNVAKNVQPPLKGKDKRLLISHLLEENALRDVVQKMCADQTQKVEASQQNLPTIYITRTSESRCDKQESGMYLVKNMAINWVFD